MSKIFKKIARIAPIATAFIPGIGPLAGAAIGAAGGALSGGGLKGALLGGATGALGAGGAKGLVSKFAPGLGATAATAASRALTGAATGTYTGGGLKSALVGGALGGASALLPASLGGAAKAATKAPRVASAASSALGNSGATAAGKALNGGGIIGALKGGVNSGLDVLSGAGKAVGSIFGGGGAAEAGKAASEGLSGSGLITGALLGNSLSGLMDAGADAYSDYDQYETTEDIQRALLEAQGRAAKVLEPYQKLAQESTDKMRQTINSMPNYSQKIATGISDGTLGGSFDMQDFRTDPGYEFRRQEGEQAMQRSLAAMGLSQSGSAIKRAMEFNQGLADQSYGDAFSRWATEQGINADLLTGQQGVQNGLIAGQQALGAAADGTAADIELNRGNISAGGLRDRSNALSKLLSGLFGPRDEDELLGVA